jgi:uncharacterized protein (TIGR03000 family)
VGGGFLVGSAGTVPTESFGSTQTVTAARISEPAMAPATLTVELPPSARLFVDGAAVNGTGSARRYHTPELPAGQAFFYDLKAEVLVNGTPVVEETRAVVRAGESISVAFPKLTAAVGGSTNAVAAAR